MEAWMTFVYLLVQCEKCSRALGIKPESAMAGMDQILNAYRFGEA